MANWFEVKTKFDKTQENGAVKRVTEKYLTDALSVTEAEARVTEETRPYISGDFFATSVRQTRIAEVFNPEAERFYLAKVAFITIDERTATEKRAISQMLVGALDFANAIVEFNDGMKGTMADFELVSLSETPIMAVFPAKLAEHHEKD